MVDKSLWIICDANVFVQCFLISKEMLLKDREYDSGWIVVHDETLAELQEWCTSSAKIQKFSKQLIVDMVTLASDLSESDPALSEHELERYTRRIAKAEEGLKESDRSKRTSKSDKKLLAIAHKCNGMLATHDLTLRSLAKIIMANPDKLLSVGNLVSDKFHNGKLTRDDIVNGIKNLDYYGEGLRQDDRTVLDHLIN